MQRGFYRYGVSKIMNQLGLLNDGHADGGYQIQSTPDPMPYPEFIIKWIAPNYSDENIREFLIDEGFTGS